MISRITFASLPVTDPDRALAFWRDVMGLEVTADSEAMPGMRWIMLRPQGAETQLHLDIVDAVPKAKKPALPLIVGNLSGTLETLRAKGVAILAGPKEAEWDPSIRYALIRDSEGNVIFLASG